MNLVVNNNCSNGISGHFLVSISNIVKQWDDILHLPNVEEEKINIILNSFYMNKKAFDYVFKQNRSSIVDILTHEINDTHQAGILIKQDRLSLIPGREYSRDHFVEHYRDIIGIIFEKLIFQDEIKENVNNFIAKNKIGKNTLGVHIRLTDMNHLHPQYGKADTNTYIREIDKVIDKYNNIFLMTDNFESLAKIKSRYGDKITNFFSKHLATSETDDFISEMRSFTNTSTKAWTDLFTEMIIMSKCDYIFGRTSSVTFASALLSKNLHLCKNYKIINN